MLKDPQGFRGEKWRNYWFDRKRFRDSDIFKGFLFFKNDARPPSPNRVKQIIDNALLSRFLSYILYASVGISCSTWLPTTISHKSFPIRLILISNFHDWHLSTVNFSIQSVVSFILKWLLVFLVHAIQPESSTSHHKRLSQLQFSHKHWHCI